MTEGFFTKISSNTRNHANQDKRGKAILISNLLPIPNHIRAHVLGKEHNNRI
jgi:hypothetical protein